MLKFASKTRLFHSSIFALKRTPFNLADIGEGISEVELIQWFVKEGDMVEEFTKICEVQSDKAAVEISSRYEGKILKLYHEVGAVAKVGTPLVDIDVVGEDVKEEEAVKPVPVAKSVESPKENPSQPSSVDAIEDKSAVFATPAVRRIAREHKVDISHVKGTGPQSRVLKGDILAFVNGASPQSITPSVSAGICSSNTDGIKTQGDVVKPFTPIQKAMFKSMTKSLSIPHFGFSDEVTVNATTAFRQQLNTHLQALPKGKYPFAKVSYMPIFLKALSEALKAFPVLNSQIVDLDKTPQLLFKSSHNIGIAMDTPNG
jgi:2-oxoisovalerate dehydrogenase E2 component (dihydrolipoyl transacylase)